MNKLEKAVYLALIATRRFEDEEASLAASAASEAALDFIGTATSESHGDFGYAMWLAESEA